MRFEYSFWTLVLCSYILSDSAFYAFTALPTGKAKPLNPKKNAFQCPELQISFPVVNFCVSSSSRGSVKVQESDGDNKSSISSLQEELDKYRKRTIILQNVVEKLQSTNRQLLSLQEESAGTYVNFDHASDNKDIKNGNIWPVDMQIDMIRNEYASKEAEWENTLKMAQIKYKKMKDQAQSAFLKMQELQEEVDFFQERSQIDEAEMVKMRMTLKERNEMLKDAQDEMNELQISVEKMQNENSSLETMNRKLTTMISKFDERNYEDTSRSNHTSEDEALKWKEQSIRTRKKMEELGIMWKQRREEMEALIAERDTNVLGLEKELDKLKVENIALQGSLQDSNEKYSDIEAQLQELKKKEKDIADAALKQAKKKEFILRETLAEVEAQLNTVKIEKESIMRDKFQIESQLEAELSKIAKERKSHLEKSQMQETIWKNQLDALSDKINSYTLQNQSLFDTKVALQDEIVSLKKEHKAAIASQKSDFDAKMLKEKIEFNKLIQNFKTELEMLVNQNERPGLMKRITGRIFRIGF